MAKPICEVESCDNEAEYYDDTDNRICEEHMHQDIEETGNDPSGYERINKVQRYCVNKRKK